MITIFIIEDEIKTALALKKSIEKCFQEAVVLEIAQSIKSAVKWLKTNEAPDLIFSDIQLADGLSFDIFKQVLIKSPIIFCTAFDEYAVEAFKTNSIDYLLKPIDESKLKQSLVKYNTMKSLFGNNNAAIEAKMQNLFLQMDKGYKKTILVYFQDKMVALKIESIQYIHHDLGVVYIMTFDKKKYFMNQTLDEFESILNPNDFFRVNRQFIVNRNAISALGNYISRRLVVLLNPPNTDLITVSKTKAPLLLKWIENEL
jgi:DNA-binding LytR/AlgR family response regulator